MVDSSLQNNIFYIVYIQFEFFILNQQAQKNPRINPRVLIMRELDYAKPPDGTLT